MCKKDCMPLPIGVDFTRETFNSTDLFSPQYEDDFQPQNDFPTDVLQMHSQCVGSWTGSWVPFLIGSHGSGSDMIY